MKYRLIQSNITDPLARPLGTEIISSNIACDFYIPNFYRWAYIFQVCRGSRGRGCQDVIYFSYPDLRIGEGVWRVVVPYIMSTYVNF